MDRHRAFQPTADDVEFDRAVAPEMDTVDQPGPPNNVEQMSSPDLGLPLWKEVVLDPAAKGQYYFFYAVASSADDALQIAVAARSAATPEFWFSETKRAYQSWLQQGRQIEAPDTALRTALTRALIANKQAQQPEFGSFVAATNPAYGFKVWPRDSSVTALGLAATGHLDEAVKFYRWMASIQEDGSASNHPLGTWFSNYSFWIRKWPKAFVEPEWDAGWRRSGPGDEMGSRPDRSNGFFATITGSTFGWTSATESTARPSCKGKFPKASNLRDGWASRPRRTE